MIDFDVQGLDKLAAIVIQERAAFIATAVAKKRTDSSVTSDGSSILITGPGVPSEFAGEPWIIQAVAEA